MASTERGIESYFTPSGEKRYRVRWYEHGKHASKSFRRLSDARRKHLSVRRAQETGRRVVEAGALELTLAEFVKDTWAPKRKRRLVDTSYFRDRDIYNKHILHQLGPRPISEIETEDLVEWQDKLERERVGDSAHSKAITVLNLIFEEAMRRPRATAVTSNPVRLLEKPKTKKRRRARVWGPVVVERARYQLLVHSRRCGADKQLMALRDATLVGLMMMTGCRPGEALALRWRDLEGGEVNIERALSGKVIRDQTKTEQPRSVPLLTPLDEDLAAMRRISKGKPDDFMFRNTKGKHWRETDWRNFRGRHLKPALIRVEDEWAEWRKAVSDPRSVPESVTDLSKTRPYELGRHTHSSLMLHSGSRPIAWCRTAPDGTKFRPPRCP